MKIAFISDTHNQHKHINRFDNIDILIHAGDISSRGTETEINNFIEWFNAIPVKYKIFIAGNHDFNLEKVSNDFIKGN